MSEHVYNTWFAAILPQDDSDLDTLKLAVRDQFARDWLQEHYGSFLHQEVYNLEARSVAIDWLVEPSLFTQKPIATDALQATQKPETLAAAPAPKRPTPKVKPLRLNQN